MSAKMNEKVYISEVFYSICGEGTEIGRPAIFIRFAGCNLRCCYCDTKYSQQQTGEQYSLWTILSKVDQLSVSTECKLIFLTGGDPGVQYPTFMPLIEELESCTFEMIVQTNGTHYMPSLFEKCSLISIDVKGPSSNQGSDDTVIASTIQQFQHKAIQLKFLIQDEQDFKFARQYIRSSQLTPNVTPILGVVGGIDLKPLIEMVLDSDIAKYNVRVLPQLHKIVWGPNKRGV